VGKEQTGSLRSNSVVPVDEKKNMEGNGVTLPFFSDVESLSRFVVLEKETKKNIENVSRHYPFRISPFYASLMEAENPRCPIRLQAIPSVEELGSQGVPDPLGESGIAVTPSFYKRYPKRGVFLVCAECAMYCRFCNRRRFVGKGFKPEDSREETLAYIEQSKDITEVILSGGDPLMLEQGDLGYILERLKRMKHIRLIRISSRMPVVFPERALTHVQTIAKYAPLWLIVHTNHPREISREFVGVIRQLRAVGVSVVSQSVLLRGVNDCHYILGRLFERLVEVGIKPYYLFQLDDVRGATHFKVRLDTGMAIMRSLRAEVSGLCIPQYAVDITGGLGKIPLEGGYLKDRDGDAVNMTNLYDKEGIYLDNGGASTCLQCGLCKQ
jgi:lysine 2,3-aminomutase